ncbi:hypothetical protein ACFL54_03985 [Planctomycetota bacterium]
MSSLRKFGAGFPWPLRALGRGSISNGKVMGEFITAMGMAILYWMIIPFFTFIKFGDPLRLREDKESAGYWQEPKKMDQTIDRYSRES